MATGHVTIPQTGFKMTCQYWFLTTELCEEKYIPYPQDVSDGSSIFTLLIILYILKTFEFLDVFFWHQSLLNSLLSQGMMW